MEVDLVLAGLGLEQCAMCAGLLDWIVRIAGLALSIKTDKTRIACVPNRSHHREDAGPNPSP